MNKKVPAHRRSDSKKIISYSSNEWCGEEEPDDPKILTRCRVHDGIMVKPITLPRCQHNICESCLVSMKRKDGKCLRCPICNMRCFVSSQYNTVLDKLIHLQFPEEYKEREASLDKIHPPDKLYEEMREDIIGSVWEEMCNVKDRATVFPKKLKFPGGPMIGHTYALDSISIWGNYKIYAPIVIGILITNIIVNLFGGSLPSAVTPLMGMVNIAVAFLLGGLLHIITHNDVGMGERWTRLRQLATRGRDAEESENASPRSRNFLLHYTDESDESVD